MNYGVLRASVGLAMIALMGVACISGESDPNAEELSGEDVGEAAEAVGLGGTCTITSACDSGLSCCYQHKYIGTCRDLQADNDNCGACGHECNFPYYCVTGVCRNLFPVWP